MPNTILIRRPELRQRVPLSDTRIWELEKKGKFPRRIRLSANVVAWDLAEINAWIEDRRAEGTAQAASAPDVRKRRWRPVRGEKTAQVEPASSRTVKEKAVAHKAGAQ